MPAVNCRGNVYYKSFLPKHITTTETEFDVYTFHVITIEDAASVIDQGFSPFFFFLSGFSFTDIDDSQDSRGREGTILYSTLPLPPTHEHSGIYLQLCM